MVTGRPPGAVAGPARLRFPVTLIAAGVILAVHLVSALAALTRAPA